MAALDLDALSLVRTVTAALGATIFVLGLRAHARTRRRSVLLFALGMGVASLGYLLEGALVNAAGWTLERATALEAVFSLTAFSLLAAGLWVRDARPAGSSAEPAA